MEVDRDDLKMWLDSSITKLVMRKMEEERMYQLEELASGATLAENFASTSQNTAKAVGYIEGLDYILQRKFLDD